VRRERILIAACAAVVTALAWAYLIRLDRQMTLEMAAWCLRPLAGSPAPDASKLAMDMPLNAAGVWLTFAMWAVMMVGMMAPAATPVVMLYAGARKGRPVAVLLVALGYIAVWTAFSAAAALAQSGLHWAAMLSMAMSTLSARVGGAILIVAGVYQLSPWKGACLAHCRSPLGFLMTNWRDGNLGAAQMGVRHGVYCLGCCWALMCVLFAVGIMNLVWVAGLTVFVLVEKLGPAGGWVARAGGAAMILLGAKTALLA
jgi:predicted metal-binding membrane protein